MTNFEDKISLMIPAYLRGELSEDERQEIENLAAKNPAIAADIEFQRNLKSSIKSNIDAFEPGELAWAKLAKAMNEPDTMASTAENKESTSPKFWKYAAIALAVATIGQAAMFGSITSKTDQDAQYVTASDTVSDVYIAKVGFNPNVNEAQITKTLQKFEANIVAGPSSLGLYDIQFKSISACHQAVELLKSTPKIMQTVTACE